MDRRPELEVVPLGGVGEFGMNTMHVASGETALLIDAGVMFPTPDLPGIDLVVPDFTYIRDDPRPLSALVLTHGHDDHIGGVPYLWDLLAGPVYGTPLTLALLEPKLEEHAIEAQGRLVPVEAGSTVTVGGIDVEFLRVTHSIPACVALALHTPAGTIVHTGDYKLDPAPPGGDPCDVDRLTALGDAGVLALFGDSTNVERPGAAGSEADVVPAFETLLATTRGKLVVATFASSLHRIQLLVDLADRFGRRVAFVGRGLARNVAAATRLGHLRIPAGVQIAEHDVAAHPPDQVMCLVTGSQGEPLAALSRIAVHDHRHVALAPGDAVVLSARAIPGNQVAIGRLLDHLARRGVDVIDEAAMPVHVSGHAYRDELRAMLEMVRPRHFVPIHGEYRYLMRHARLAESVDATTTVLMAENGDRVCFDREGGWIDARVPAGRRFIDRTRTGTVADEVLRDRRHLAADGVIVLLLGIDGRTGQLTAAPCIATRGFVTDAATTILLEELPRVVAEVVQAATVDAPGLDDAGTDCGVLQERVRLAVRRTVRRRTGRRPLVLPVIMER